MMAAFVNLEDSPMFRKQIHSLEHTSDELKDRCQKLQKGSKRFVASLGESYDGDFAFADSLEAFGAGQDDPISVAIGGPVMSKFTTAIREIGTYKELLRSQVEHMLSDRVMQFIANDLQNAKDCRRRFDKATQVYDQARERFMSVKRGTRADVVTGLEEDLHNSKSAFEKCRFNLVNALANIEAKRKFEFLESISAVMDAHMRFFKQGYELLSQMEPFIHQVLTYAQQSKEMANAEQDKLAKRIQEFRTQAELASLRSFSKLDTSTSGDGIHVVGVNSYKNIEALMHSTANGEVKTIKQGYLLKRSSNLRGDWKRRFFVLDSHGTLYYYRNKWNKQTAEDSIGCHTLDLQTSTIKIDAEQTDLRFCFRIISPMKTCTLQAESATERMDWVDKITGVIASLLTSPNLNKHSSRRMDTDNKSFTDTSGSDYCLLEDLNIKGYSGVSMLLRNIPGNDVCAECSAPEPEWASLNLGILVCIECSGVHRNLGVHISKVRSLTLDVKVWEPAILDLFSALGNSYCNSVWEELLLQGEGVGELSIQKPQPKDTILRKEKYIQLKYVDKILIVRETTLPDLPLLTVRIWEAVKTNNIQATYRLLVVSDVNPNTRYDEVSGDNHHLEDTASPKDSGYRESKQFDPTACQKIEVSGEPDTCLQGCTLLHLACHVGDPVMLELLLQFGADINRQDFHGRTPLHHCIFKKSDALAKFLIRRGARTSIRDGGGLTALERTMELGAITDEELFILLAGHE
ncbi:putative ADP-ribosylation factor GTPase-activating protein AGD2 [Iris pallida]|uniref:ADP-ribosylation factor GTPase-activating protein AGD2 n=1 Tax=Iris pallida TaxID=29817 RepID=A0AAX6HEV2_IRIPA|nr:putative ADP-ribosylation factor GTPase-activating protein AGD2 [Iris pallida]